MTFLVIAMFVCVAAAGGVLALVALPRLRSGESVLTPDGREAVEDAARRARAVTAGRLPRAERPHQPRPSTGPTPGLSENPAPE